MSKLKRFNKSNKKRNIIIASAFFAVSLLIAGISYAVYQKEDEILFINARVGEFETSSSDIELAMKLDGENIDTPPSKGYYNVTVECDHADGEWDKEKWGAVITNISSNRVKCNVNFETLETRPLSIVEVGDYISMTPTATSYTIPTSLTGYSSNQTINPSELNLWRVISKNEDGTVEVVSEYVSSTAVYFRGQTGYLNFVGSLNTIAAQYINEKYVSKTRHMGYSNQVETCMGPLKYGNTGDCKADTGYETDINLLKSVIGTLIEKNPNGTETNYWLASRYYGGLAHDCHGRLVKSDGSISADPFYDMYKGGGTDSYEQRNAVLPILILRSDIKIVNGDGKSAATAYQLQ